MPAPPPTVQVMKAAVEYPDICQWFRFLDDHEGHNKDSIKFSSFGTVLKKKGFIRITQLTLGFITLTDLQEWLAVDVGTAILIMQYAKEDTETIKAGGWVFPKEKYS